MTIEIQDKPVGYYIQERRDGELLEHCESLEAALASRENEHREFDTRVVYSDVHSMHTVTGWRTEYA